MVCKVHCMIVLLFSQYPSPINHARSPDLYVLYIIRIPVQGFPAQSLPGPLSGAIFLPGRVFSFPALREIKSCPQGNAQLLCGIHIVVTLRLQYVSISRVLYIWRNLQQSEHHQPSPSSSLSLVPAGNNRQSYSVALRRRKTCSRLRIY